MAKKRKTFAPAKARRKSTQKSRMEAGRQLGRRLLMLTLGLVVLAALLGLAKEDKGPTGDWFSDLRSLPAERAVLQGRRIGLISGHRGYDTGAVCPDGRTEVDTVAPLAVQVARRLQRAGAQVDLLDEYDQRLRGYEADVLVSIHADSCIDRSGFKVAHAVASPIPQVEDRLVACLTQEYAAATGLAFDSDTITVDMTEYHAFKRVASGTPAAIVEVGFLGGDRDLLTLHSDAAIRGLAQGILCFFRSEP